MEGNHRGKQMRNSNPRRESCLFRAQNKRRCCCIAARMTPRIGAMQVLFLFSFMKNPSMALLKVSGSSWSSLVSMKRQWSLILIYLCWFHEKPEELDVDLSSLMAMKRAEELDPHLHWCAWRIGAEELDSESLSIDIHEDEGQRSLIWSVFTWVHEQAERSFDPHLYSSDVHEEAEELDPHLYSINVHEEAKELDPHLS